MKCEEIENEYKCVKCRDMTFIIDDGIATPCECRALREAEDILRKSGIGKEFRNKRFDNFDFLEVWLLWKVIKELWIMRMSF